MVFRESRCNSVCVEVMETQKTQFSHLWPKREGTEMALEAKVKEPEQCRSSSTNFEEMGLNLDTSSEWQTAWDENGFTSDLTKKRWHWRAISVVFPWFITGLKAGLRYKQPPGKDGKKKCTWALEKVTKRHLLFLVFLEVCSLELLKKEWD